MMVRSFEENVKKWAYGKLEAAKLDGSIENYCVDRDVNGLDIEIGSALKASPSKLGGEGGGCPDSQAMLVVNGKQVPVLFEFKGTKGKLRKLTKSGLVELFTSSHSWNWRTIDNYAVNGAVYYTSQVLKRVTKFPYILAVGVNGFADRGDAVYEVSCYVLLREDSELPIHIGDFSDLSFLSSENISRLVEDAIASPEEIEMRLLDEEQRYKTVLNDLNQNLRDTESIAVSQRVDLVVACIMAALGYKNVAPLEVDDLKGSAEDGLSDGALIKRKAENYLKARKLPSKKISQVVTLLSTTLENGMLEVVSPDTNETPVKSTYRIVKQEIVPLLANSKRNDFMGRLFNTMYQWVTVPDGDQNDVVLTPRYVASLMARLARVDMNSYVWDWALGSGGLLIAAMNEMIADAENRLSQSPAELAEKIESIREKQLLGIERLPNIYVLAVLNMILMGDGSANILQTDSLKSYDGTYFGRKEKFPANAVLINPPYSAEGNGMVFLDSALKKMSSGRAVIIIQDSAGKGKATSFNKSILKNNSLIASIKMPKDLFPGRVQTSIYVIEIGHAHDKDSQVKFIDFRVDGYKRTYRKKSADNLRIVDNAVERYNDLVSIINNGKRDSRYYRYGIEVFEDTIDPNNGDDWNYEAHNSKTASMGADDFQKTVAHYLSWKTTRLIEDTPFADIENTRNCTKSVRLSEIFDKVENLNKLPYQVGSLPKCAEGSYTLPALSAGTIIKAWPLTSPETVPLCLTT